LNASGRRASRYELIAGSTLRNAYRPPSVDAGLVTGILKFASWARLTHEKSADISNQMTSRAIYSHENIGRTRGGFVVTKSKNDHVCHDLTGGKIDRGSESWGSGVLICHDRARAIRVHCNQVEIDPDSVRWNSATDCRTTLRLKVDWLVGPVVSYSHV
jgi:hypothetical protein